MHTGFLLIPIIAACIGWGTVKAGFYLLFSPRLPKKFLGIRFQGILPNRREEMAQKMAKAGKAAFFSADLLKNKISDPATLQQLIPVIEVHVDDFLRVKLAKQMPVISMFIGDKTINELKTVFMGELTELFPVIMNQYADKLLSDIDPEKLIYEKLSSFSMEDMESTLRQGLAREIRYFALLGGLIGFLAGWIQVGVACLS